MSSILPNITRTIGRTPVVRLNRIAPSNVNLSVKVEAFNPGSSVKDRLAIAIIEDAERTGALKPGQTIVEATSGNTGVALAMVCAAKGYPLVITMAESFSMERRKLIRFFGAKLVLTPKAGSGTEMVRKAEELAAENGWFLPRQFANEANPRYHAATTAAEIVQTYCDTPLYALVTGQGTGGTVVGVGRTLRAAMPETKIVLAEPDIARIVEGKTDFSPHAIQGWNPNFVSDIVQRAKESQTPLADAFEPVSGEEAIEMSRRLAAEEGILTGISGGATVAAAVKVAQSAPDGAHLLAMLPDTGERYLSTPLFDNVLAGQDPDFEDYHKLE